jgi:hypothetical protein
VPIIFIRFKWHSNFLDRPSKTLSIKFHENPSSGSRVVPYGRKDKHDEANSRFPKYYERAQKFNTAHSMHSNILILLTKTEDFCVQN